MPAFNNFAKRRGVEVVVGEIVRDEAAFRKGWATMRKATREGVVGEGGGGDAVAEKCEAESDREEEGKRVGK
ncbi:hypothetical protein Droror1_Dr00006988 [Drosera rotundifolia]